MNDLNYRFVYKHFRFVDVPQTSRLPTYTAPARDRFKGRHGIAYWFTRSVSKWIPTGNGGYTACIVYDQDGNKLAESVAECSPKDQFCYRIGREIAKGRALDYLKKKRERELREAAEDAYMVGKNTGEWIEVEVEE